MFCHIRSLFAMFYISQMFRGFSTCPSPPFKAYAPRTREPKPSDSIHQEIKLYSNKLWLIVFNWAEKKKTKKTKGQYKEKQRA